MAGDLNFERLEKKKENNSDEKYFNKSYVML